MEQNYFKIRISETRKVSWKTFFSKIHSYYLSIFRALLSHNQINMIEKHSKKPQQFLKLIMITRILYFSCDNGPIAVQLNGRRVVASRLSDRPQSSMSSALTSAMVYGCGGKCQTFESVCYFVLQVRLFKDYLLHSSTCWPFSTLFQLLFAMGVLIGMSLCIAGLVLRKSAARNLQVLVYIGILLAAVSGVLLSIQCRAKNTARRRIKAIQTAKRGPIQMETLNIRANPVHNLERLPSIREAQK